MSEQEQADYVAKKCNELRESLLNRYVKAKINRSQPFQIDKMQQVWQALSVELQAFVLRSADIDEKPLPWGGYNEMQKRRIKNAFITYQELTQLQANLNRNAFRLEQRINATD